ncbi:MAG: monovalent cation/H+ antiporter complex subunit F [Oligoflexus sp.]
MNEDSLNTILYFLLSSNGFALLFASFRLIRGPSLSDRVMALDLIAIIIIAILAICSIAYDATYLLDIAIVMALISFIGTVAFSMFIQKRAQT